MNGIWVRALLGPMHLGLKTALFALDVLDNGHYYAPLKDLAAYGL
jgi:hypothetical protein